MIPVSDGMSDTTQAIYRRSPLHLSRGSWFDLPRTESATSKEHRDDLKRALLLIKGRVPRSKPEPESQSIEAFNRTWQERPMPQTGSVSAFGTSILSRDETAPVRKWSFERVPSLLPSSLDRDTGLFGRSCADRPRPQPLGLRYATSFSWPGGESSGMPFLPWAVDDLASSSIALEVLICDDGSRDGSTEWLETLQSLLDQVPPTPATPTERLPTAALETPPSDSPWVRQELPDFCLLQEPWVGEDLAAPSPEDIAQKLRSRGHRFVLLKSDGRGQGAAQNACLQASTASLIGLMDADDRGEPDRFEKLLDAMKKHPDWTAVCSQVRIFGTVSEGMNTYVNWQNGLLQPEELMQNRFVEIPALHQSGLYPRSLLLETLNGYRDLPGWPIDIDTWMRLAEAGARIGKVPQQLYGWRQHTLQSTRNHGRCGLDRLRNCKAHFLMRTLPPQVRRVEIWSTGRTLHGWKEALQCQLAEKDNKLELALFNWQPKGRSRGGAQRKEGGGGAAANATVKTEAEMEAENEQDANGNSGYPKEDREEKEMFVEVTQASSPPPPLPESEDLVVRVFAYGSHKVREQARCSSQGPSGSSGSSGPSAPGGNMSTVPPRRLSSRSLSMSIPQWDDAKYAGTAIRGSDGRFLGF
eukprot:s2670_g5.t3